MIDQIASYDKNFRSLNYGSLGSLLGHELTHGFDSAGRFYDEEGNFKSFWSNETIKNFINRSVCLGLLTGLQVEF